MRRCEIQARGEARCRCVIAEENVQPHAVYTEDGLGPYIICENHLKVVRRGHQLRTRDGKRWRGYWSSRGVWLIPMLASCADELGEGG